MIIMPRKLQSEDETSTTKTNFRETPLLGSGRKKYDTTSISDMKDVNSDSKKYDWDMLTESEESGDNDAALMHWDYELQEIQQLLDWAQKMDENVMLYYYTMPPWMLKTSLVIFMTLSVIACCVGILIIFAVETEFMPIYQFTIVVIAILGNCLGSAAVKYSGSQKQDYETLRRGAVRLRMISNNLETHMDTIFLHRLALSRTEVALGKEADKLWAEIKFLKKTDKAIEHSEKVLEWSAMKLRTQNHQLHYEKRQIAKETKNYKKNLSHLNRNAQKLNKYHNRAQRRADNLSLVINKLEKTVPELDNQLQRLELFREAVENATTQAAGDVGNTWTKVQSMFSELKGLSIRLERIMLYKLMERVLSTSRNRDEMSITTFNRFLAQIPKVYVGHKYGGGWFERVARNGYIWRKDLNNMIDNITLKHIEDEEKG